jgi:protein-arginine kinase activator protein McsA
VCVRVYNRYMYIYIHENCSYINPVTPLLSLMHWMNITNSEVRRKIELICCLCYSYYHDYVQSVQRSSTLERVMHAHNGRETGDSYHDAKNQRQQIVPVYF